MTRRTSRSTSPKARVTSGSTTLTKWSKTAKPSTPVQAGSSTQWALAIPSFQEHLRSRRGLNSEQPLYPSNRSQLKSNASRRKIKSSWRPKDSRRKLKKEQDQLPKQKPNESKKRSDRKNQRPTGHEKLRQTRQKNRMNQTQASSMSMSQICWRRQMPRR